MRHLAKFVFELAEVLHLGPAFVDEGIEAVIEPAGADAQLLSDFAPRQVGVDLQHAQHPKVGVFLQLRAAAGGGRGHVWWAALGGWALFLRFKMATAVRALFGSGYTGVFLLGYWRGVAGMTVRKRRILVVVCRFGALRTMFFLASSAGTDTGSVAGVTNIWIPGGSWCSRL